MSKHLSSLLNQLSIQDLRILNQEFGHSNTGHRNILIKRLINLTPNLNFQIGGAQTESEQFDWTEILKLDSFFQQFGEDQSLAEIKENLAENDLKIDYTPWYQILLKPTIKNKKEPPYQGLPKFVKLTPLKNRYFNQVYNLRIFYPDYPELIDYETIKYGDASRDAAAQKALHYRFALWTLSQNPELDYVDVVRSQSFKESWKALKNDVNIRDEFEKIWVPFMNQLIKDTKNEKYLNEQFKRGELINLPDLVKAKRRLN